MVMTLAEPGRIVDQAHLAKAFTCTQNGQDDFLALGVRSLNLGSTRQQDIQRRRRLTLSHDHPALWESAPHARGCQRIQLTLAKP